MSTDRASKKESKPMSPRKYRSKVHIVGVGVNGVLGSDSEESCSLSEESCSLLEESCSLAEESCSLSESEEESFRACKSLGKVSADTVTTRTVGKGFESVSAIDGSEVGKVFSKFGVLYDKGGVAIPGKDVL